LLRHLITPMN
jgi:hypothetical protein